MALYRCMSGGGPTPTSITPSDASPVALTADTPVNPTESGYAIKRYIERMPSAVAGPIRLTNGNIYKMVADGYLIGVFDEITPSDSNPPRIYVDYNACRLFFPFDDGYVIKNAPVDKTPNDGTPAAVTANQIIRPSANGYLYATNHSIGACGNPSDVTGNAQPITINTGLPSIRRFFIYYIGNTGGTANCFTTYNADISTTNYITYNSTNAYNKAIGTASGYAYAASVDSISGGTITLKTGANNAAAIKSAWWVACS